MELSQLQKKYAEQWKSSSDFFYSRGYYEWMREPLKEFKTVLEIGCGCGQSTLSLLEAGHRVLAIDKDPACIDIAYELIKKKGFEDKTVFLELDISYPGVVGEIADKFQFDIVVCWNMGSYYDTAELKEFYIPRMKEYGLTMDQIKENLPSSYREYITWLACKVAALKGVPFQIINRSYEEVSEKNDDYYQRLGLEHGYSNIGHSNLKGESLSSDGISLIVQGKIQDDAIIPVVFNMVMFF